VLGLKGNQILEHFFLSLGQGHGRSLQFHSRRFTAIASTLGEKKAKCQAELTAAVCFSSTNTFGTTITGLVSVFRKQSTSN
jgi:hypothetical protein